MSAIRVYSQFAQLLDVDVSGAISGDLLTFNGSKWVLESSSGSGVLARTNSPTFVTPNIGAAFATSINGLTIESSGGSTLDIAPGSTIAFVHSFRLDGAAMSIDLTGASSGDTLRFDGTDWVPQAASGTGTVTNTGGNLTSNYVILGAGTADVKVVSGISTDGTSALNLGVAGSSVGKLVLANATSGTITMQPVAGALGSVTVSIPAATDTLVNLASAQTLTNKSISGSSNTITNVGNSSLTDTISSNVTLNVPGTYATIQAALDFLSGKRITQGATATIQVADGTYTPSRLNFNHPDGAQIRLLGNITTPANCVLDFTADPGETSGAYYEKDWGGIYVNTGHTLGYVDGFKILGPTSTSHVPKYGFAGLLAFDGACIVAGPKMVIQDCYAGIAAVNHSFIFADYVTITYGGDGGIFAYNGSAIQAANCSVGYSNTWFAQAAATIEHASALFAPGSTFHHSSIGLYIDFSSTVMLTDATISNNTIGIKSHGFGSISLFNTTFTSNTQDKDIQISSEPGDLLELMQGKTTGVVRANGKVGVNTSSPDWALDVRDAADDNAIAQAKAGTVITRLIAYKTAGTASVGSSSNHDFLLFRNDSEKMRLTSSGVNIPTLNVATSLTVGSGTGIVKRTAGVDGIGSSGTDYVAPGAITTSGLTMATARLLGRTTASSGAAEEITVGTGLSLSSTTLTAVARKTVRTFTAMDAMPTATNYATLGQRNSRATLVFADSASNQETCFMGTIPNDAVLTSGLTVVITWTTPATSGNGRFGMQLEKMNGSDIDSDSFDTAAEVTTACNGTSGIPSVTTITNTNIDSLAVGDAFFMKIYRDCSDAADTISNTIEILTVELKTAN